MVDAKDEARHSAFPAASLRQLLEVLGMDGPKDIPVIAAVVGPQVTTAQFYLDLRQRAGLMRPGRQCKPGPSLLW